MDALDHSPAGSNEGRIKGIAGFLRFVEEAQNHLHEHLVSDKSLEVREIREAIEARTDDNTRVPRIQSALYDDARALVTLWTFFRAYDHEQLQRFARMVKLELQGLTGDLHPRSVFARSPLGIAALGGAIISVWWAIVTTVSGVDVSGFRSTLEEGLGDTVITILVFVAFFGGLFVGIYYFVKIGEYRAQIADLSSIARALDLYLTDWRAKERTDDMT